MQLAVLGLTFSGDVFLRGRMCVPQDISTLCICFTVDPYVFLLFFTMTVRNLCFMFVQMYDNVTGNVICNGARSVIKEGYKSFPSGHTSCKQYYKSLFWESFLGNIM